VSPLTQFIVGFDGVFIPGILYLIWLAVR